MLIYNQNGSRMAVIITLPFITTVQSRLFSTMLEHAHEVHSEEWRGIGSPGPLGIESLK